MLFLPYRTALKRCFKHIFLQNFPAEDHFPIWEKGVLHTQWLGNTISTEDSWWNWPSNFISWGLQLLKGPDFVLFWEIFISSIRTGFLTYLLRFVIAVWWPLNPNLKLHYTALSTRCWRWFVYLASRAWLGSVLPVRRQRNSRVSLLELHNVSAQALCHFRFYLHYPFDVLAALRNARVQSPRNLRFWEK